MSHKPQILSGPEGGTGVANASTITLGGAFVTSGANSLTLTTTGATNVTLPTSGTLATTAGSVAGPGSSTDRAIATWNGTGGTTLFNNSTATITSGGQLLTANATAGTPTYSFVSSATTGLYRTSGGSVGIANGGIGWFTIDSGGDARLEGNVTIANKLTCGASNVFQRTSSATNITDVNNGFIFACTNTSSARTVALSNGSSAGRLLIVKDESGGAATNNITISVTGGTKTIDNALTYVINTNYGSVMLYYDGTNYFTC